MYDGESFGSLSGSYELKVREGGEYNLYIISATSDYLTLKQGTINLSKQRGKVKWIGKGVHLTKLNLILP